MRNTVENIGLNNKRNRNKKIVKIVIPILFAVIIIPILIITVIVPTIKYSAAVELKEAGDYLAAITAFNKLDGFRDSEEMIIDCNYDIAVQLMNEGKYINAAQYFSRLGEYKDSKTKLSECTENFSEERYGHAVEVFNEGEYEDALTAFKELNGYKDSEEKRAIIRKSFLKDIKVGDYIRFGAYEQDNDIENGKEDIEWLVLEFKNDKALVISKYAIECMAYSTNYKDATWEFCSLRKWLNDEFVSTAFPKTEKEMIPIVTVEADMNPSSSITPGNATQDQIFLLSMIEADEYFNSDTVRQCAPTEYSLAKGANINRISGNCRWWLRSPGLENDCAAFVYGHGEIDFYGCNNITNTYTVRPAMWIDLSDLD